MVIFRYPYHRLDDALAALPIDERFTQHEEMRFKLR